MNMYLEDEMPDLDDEEIDFGQYRPLRMKGTKKQSKHADRRGWDDDDG